MTNRYSLSYDKPYFIHEASLTDYTAIRNIVREVQPDIAIHLAAISAVSFSYTHPIEVSEINYLGSVNLAEACRKEVPEFQQFLTAGTSEMYGMTLTSPKQTLTENSPLMPNSPYAVAKTAFHYYLEYMRQAQSCSSNCDIQYINYYISWLAKCLLIG